MKKIEKGIVFWTKASRNDVKSCFNENVYASHTITRSFKRFSNAVLYTKNNFKFSVIVVFVPIA